MKMNLFSYSIFKLCQPNAKDVPPQNVILENVNTFKKVSILIAEEQHVQDVPNVVNLNVRNLVVNGHPDRNIVFVVKQEIILEKEFSRFVLEKYLK